MPNRDNGSMNRINGCPFDSERVQCSETLSDVLQSFDFIAYCTSADFEQEARIAGSNNRRLPSKEFAYRWRFHLTPTLLESQRVFLTIYARYFHKPMYKASKMSLESRKSHDESNNFPRLSMLQASCGFGKPNWGKIQALKKNIF